MNKWILMGVLTTGWLLTSFLVNATEIVVYKGQIDKAGDVVLELQPSDHGSGYTGRYFYTRHGVDIALNGKLAALKEGEDEEEGSPQWRGKLAGNHFSGVWVDAKKHRSLPFDLLRAGSYDSSPSSMPPIPFGNSASDYGTHGLSPYEQLKMQIPMKQGPEIIAGKVAYRMVTDPRTHIAYPRLSRHPNARVMEKINRLLTQRHALLIENMLDCSAEAWPSPEGVQTGSAQEQATVTHFTPQLMSIIESGDSYCGGAYPTSHRDPYTIDLLRGGYLDFDRLFDFSAHDADGGPSKALRAFIVAHLKDPAMRVNNPNVDDQDDCVGPDSAWPDMYFTAYFDRMGALVFAVAGLPHQGMACAGDVLRVPYARLKSMTHPAAATYLSTGS